MIFTRLFVLGAAIVLPSLAVADKAPKIVTDIAPLASLALMVAPEADVQVLAQDADPHHITLRPSDIRALAQADLVVWMGHEFSHWMEDALAATQRNNADLALSSTARHEWLDPTQAATWTNQIAMMLGQVHPEQAGAYQQAAANAQKELAGLEADLSAELAPFSGLRLLTAHDAYGAFAARFGLTIVASLSNAHGDKPSAAKLAELNNLLRAGQVDCLFEDAGEHDEAAHMLAEGNAIYQGVLDPLGSGPVTSDSYAAILWGIASEIAACAAATTAN